MISKIYILFTNPQKKDALYFQNILCNQYHIKQTICLLNMSNTGFTTPFNIHDAFEMSLSSLPKKLSSFKRILVVEFEPLTKTIIKTALTSKAKESEIRTFLPKEYRQLELWQLESQLQKEDFTK